MRAIGVAFALWASLPAWAAPVTVRLDLAQGRVDPTARAQLRVWMDGSAPSSALVMVVRPAETTTLDLAKGVWHVEAELEGFWAAAATVRPTEASEVTLQLYQTAELAGTLRFPSGGPTPPALELRFDPPPGRGDGMPKGTMSCPVREDHWRCALPRGRFDLRFTVEGWAPLYQWDVAVPPPELKDVARLDFTAGASVVGWVEPEPGAATPRECTVTLTPAGPGAVRDAVVERRAERASLSTRASPRGFFQFPGVPPGRYGFEARAEGFAPSRIAPVEVGDGLELQLPEHVVLRRPVDVEVVVAPPLTPLGHAWQVELSGLPPATEAYKGPATPSGSWRQKGVVPGRYMVRVGAGEEGYWSSQEVDVAADARRVEIQMRVVSVTGKVVRGDDVVPGAVLWFGGRSGARSLRLGADDEGRFEGFLPEPGAWRLQVSLDGNTITLDDIDVPEPSGTPSVELTVEIPDTALRGEVVDERGQPVAGAEIRAVSLFASAVTGGGVRSPASARSDDAGVFHLLGLPPGDLSVRAEEGKRASDWVAARLDEGGATPRVRLTLRDPGSWRGHVVAPSGPVGGARVIALPQLDGRTPAGMAHTTSAPDGSFDLALPGAVVEVTLVVTTPLGALRVQRVTGPPANGVVVFVDPFGGRLTLDWNGQGGPAQPLLGCADALVPVGLLALATGTPLDRGQLVLENAGPGPYRLCMGHPRLASAACVEGRLDPSGDLHLVLPERSAQAAQK